jgi:hypothetical protein
MGHRTVSLVAGTPAVPAKLLDDPWVPGSRAVPPAVDERHLFVQDFQVGEVKLQILAETLRGLSHSVSLGQLMGIRQGTKRRGFERGEARRLAPELGKATLRQELKTGAIKRSSRDLALAEEWATLTDPPWPGVRRPRLRRRRP